MAIARRFIVDRLRSEFGAVEVTYGYETKIKRHKNLLPKSHVNDAFIIGGGFSQKRCESLNIIQKHRNNRSLGIHRKGCSPASRKKRYKIQPGDLIWVKRQCMSSKGCQNLGKTILLENKKTVGIKHIEKIYNFGSFIYRQEKIIYD